MVDASYAGGPDVGRSSRFSGELAAALDSLPVLVWVSGPDKGGIYFNSAWLEVTGRTLEQEAGEGWIEGVHLDDLPVLEGCADAFVGRRPFEIEFRLRRHDGAWRWLLDQAVPRFAPDGEFLGFIGCCVDVTERREFEAALRSSEERLQLAQEAASVGTYDWDIPGNRITWSPGMFRLHAIDPATPPDAIYSAWLERLHPEDRERADQETREFVENADNLGIEFRIIHPDGSIRWIQGRGRMVRDARGRPLRMIGANFDVTERRAAEEALRESEQRLRDVAENFPGMIFRRITYPDGRIEYPYFSGADEHVFHIPRERLQTIRSMEEVARLIHLEDIGDMLARYEQAAESLTPLEVEGRVLSDDGEVRWVRSISRPRRRDDGALIWDGVLLDVTEQHKQQGERERAATMLRMAMEVGGIGTWEFDPAGGIILGSAITNAIFGLPEDDRPRPLDDYIRAVHPEDAERVRSGLVKGAAQKRSTAREYRVITAGGDVRWVQSHGSYVRLADGSERLIGALYDITQRKRHEEEREAALRQQQVLLRELNHRIKNNLQMVSSVLHLQAARLKDPEAREQFRRAVDRVQTIGDLHAQLGFEGGLGRIDFGEYLQKLCDKLRKSVLAEGRVALRCETVPCTIDLDRAVPLGLVVNELVTNSIKHAFPDGSSGVISISLERGSSDSLVIVVSDSGGRAPPELPAGGGLGMRLIAGLSAQLGAAVETRAGPGVTTVIHLPARAARSVS